MQLNAGVGPVLRIYWSDAYDRQQFAREHVLKLLRGLLLLGLLLQDVSGCGSNGMVRRFVQTVIAQRKLNPPIFAVGDRKGLSGDRYPRSLRLLLQSTPAFARRRQIGYEDAVP